MAGSLKKSGFTLIELLVTVAVLSIIVTIAVPTFRDIIISNSVAFSRDQFFQVLTYARSEAIKTGSSVSVCKSVTGTSCDTSLDWADGWLAFVDADQDGVVDTGDRILKSQSGLESGVSMSHGSGDHVVTFNARGLSESGDGLITFSHPSESAYDRTIDLGVTGRATKGT